MILFESKYKKLYNSIIHNFLKVEIYRKQKDVGDYVEKLVPKYLYREQFKQCEQAFNDIYNWTSDKFNHNLNSLHLLILYKFLEYLCFKQKSSSSFNDRYFNNENKKLIQDFIKFEELIDEKHNFFDIHWYIENIFNDTNFLNIENLIKENTLDNYLNNNKEYINLYYDVLPLNIQIKYKLENIDLYEEIKKLLNFIELCINKQNLSMMFWENNQPMTEPRIQVVLENYIDAYFHNFDIDINRESFVGSGKIDFKFFKNKREIVLFEIKKAENSNLKAGYETQLVEYMKSCNCKQAFYLILCFNDKDYKRANNFIKKLENKNPNIEIIILDVRVSNKKVNELNKINLNNEVPESIDAYFRRICDILNINNIEEAKEYLIDIKNNYNRLESVKIKKDYIAKLQEMYYKDINCYNPMEKFFNKDKFYTIIEKDKSPQKLIMDLIGPIKSEEKVNSTLESIISIFDEMVYEEKTTCIKAEEIKEIFEYIKSNYSSLYEILTKLNLKIFIVDIYNYQSYSSCIPSNNFIDFSILCFNVKIDKFPKSNVIYEFLYQLGLIFCFVAEKYIKNISDIFVQIISQVINTPDSSKISSKQIFADFFAMNIMNDSKYQKYNPFNQFGSKFYTGLSNYFNHLFDKILLNINEESYNDIF